MAGGGALDSMNKTIQQNRSILKNRNSLFNNKDHGYTATQKTYHFRKATKEEMLAIKNKINNFKKRELRRKIFVYLTSIVASLIIIKVILYLLKYYF